MNSLPDQKSHEFDAFLRGPSLRGLSSSGLGWKGALIEDIQGASPSCLLA